MYVTAESIVRQVRDAIRRKDPAAEAHMGRFDQWIQDRIEDARRNKRLLTPQQYSDHQQKREFQVGDRLRYIGETSLLPSQVTGRGFLLKQGMEGHVTRVERAADRLIFSFLPDVPKDLRAAAEAGLDVEVLEIRTAAWTDYERVVS